MSRSGYGSVFAPGLFDGQVVIVTGGGTGIGRCIAHELASLGATPVLVGRHEQTLAATAAEIVDAGGSADVLVADIRKPDEVQAVASSTVERHGRIHGLVNNAGGQFPSAAEKISSNGWRSVLDLNLTATFEMTQAVFTASMQEHGGAVVSIVASMFNGFPGFAHSGAARAGVVNLTMSLASEWASYGVRVNAVAPGIIASTGLENYPQEVQAVLAERARSVPARRAGNEAEVSSAVVFLLSPAASYITGDTLRIDGASSLAAPAPRTGGHSLPEFKGFPLSSGVPAQWKDDGLEHNS
ncbi:MAG: SDR family oxidoreductase [Actinomycetota bacterium]